MSIQPNELRIGNWVLDDTKPHRWSIYDYTLNPEFYSPIPLTPEIFEKCLTKISNKEFKIEIPVDWSKTYHTGYWFIVKWYEFIATGESHTGWRPYLQKPKAYPQLKDEPPIEEIFLWGYLESLHQLQNYYFSLTGKELKINL